MAGFQEVVASKVSFGAMVKGYSWTGLKREKNSTVDAMVAT
jgi:hypothetical protein